MFAIPNRPIINIHGVTIPFTNTVVAYDYSANFNFTLSELQLPSSKDTVQTDKMLCQHNYISVV